MSEKEKSIESNYDALFTALSGIGKISSQFNMPELRESLKEMDSLLNYSAFDQPKDPRKRLCPIMSCCKCGNHKTTLYSYGDKKICKKCRKEVSK